MGFFNDIFGFDDSDEIDKQYEKARKLRESAKNNFRSTEELAKAGRAAAGVASADKAGAAKKQAKAAAVMNNATGLQASIQGASAAAQGAVEGYDEASQKAMAQEQAADKEKADIDISNAESLEDQAKLEQQRKEKKRDRISNIGSTLGAALISSDGNIKKRSYIAKELRKNGR